MQLLRWVIVLALLIGLSRPAQAGEPEFVQVSSGVWMVTVKNYAGIFANSATTKRKAIQAANDFANAKGMDAVPMGMQVERAGAGPGQWPYVEYQFRLVPKGGNETVGLKPRADMEIEVNNQSPPVGPVVVQ